MKQLTVIYLSFTLLLQGINPGLKDLVRVGDMLQHLEYHSKNCGDSFTEFFSKHYGAAKEVHEDDEGKDHEHKNLPFHHHNSEHIAIALIIPQDKFSLVKSPPIQKHSLNFIYKEGHSIPCNTDIFQPPRYL